MINEILGLIFVISVFTFLPWNILAFLPERKFKPGFHPNISVVIPAHDEESCIESTIKSVLESEYPGELEVVVVNDGSRDRTGGIVSKMMETTPNLKLFETDHVGKAMAVNRGVSESKGEVVVLLDADSQLEPDALELLTQPFSDERIGAVSGIISVVSNKNPLVWYQDFEYALSSMWRYIFNKLNCTYILPGFAAFRTRVLSEVGGFSTDTLSEDFDIGLKIRKAGYSVVMSKAVMHTNVPQSLSGVARQRVRWGRGTIQVIRKHRDMLLNPRHGLIGLYGMPNQIYFFVQGFMIIPITIYQVFSGYLEYFVSYNNYLTLSAVKYFIAWFSMFGAVELIYNTLTGVWAMTETFPLFIVSWTLTTFYHFNAMVKMKRINLKVMFAIIFFFPYFLYTLLFFIYPFLAEVNPLKTIGGHVNVWEKNR
jgi:cellulose synthase/poly-beta-1,6-N-acetylglucosamine synthase-like glycosyltransferase